MGLFERALAHAVVAGRLREAARVHGPGLVGLERLAEHHRRQGAVLLGEWAESARRDFRERAPSPDAETGEVRPQRDARP